MAETQADISWSLVFNGLQRGDLRAMLSGGNGVADPPDVEASVNGDPIEQLQISASADGFELTVKLPREALNDGVTTVVFRLANGAVLGAYPIRAGAALDRDVVIELEMLRAELDSLKAAFLADAHAPKLRIVERDLIVAEAVDAAMAATRKPQAKPETRD